MSDTDYQEKAHRLIDYVIDNAIRTIKLENSNKQHDNNHRKQKLSWKDDSKADENDKENNILLLQKTKMSDYQDKAHRLVDYVIDNAIKTIEDEEIVGGKEKTQSSVKFDVSRDATLEYAPEPIQYEEDYEIQNIEWLTIDEFSVKRAEEKIHEFIKVLHNVPFIATQCCV